MAAAEDRRPDVRAAVRAGYHPADAIRAALPGLTRWSREHGYHVSMVSRLISTGRGGTEPGGLRDVLAVYLGVPRPDLDALLARIARERVE